MPIKVERTVDKLRESDFKRVPSLTDASDMSEQLAFTGFKINTGKLTSVKTQGVFKVQDTFTVTVSPDCLAVSGKALTAELLEHEQFHYDLGLALARQFAREIPYLSGKTESELGMNYGLLSDLHFVTRSGLINSRYDVDTAHGTVKRYQKTWLAWMTACLGNEKAVKIAGYYL